MTESLLSRSVSKVPDHVRFQGRVLFLTEDPVLIQRQLAGEDLAFDPAAPVGSATHPKLRDNISTDEITPAGAAADSAATASAAATTSWMMGVLMYWVDTILRFCFRLRSLASKNFSRTSSGVKEGTGRESPVFTGFTKTISATSRMECGFSLIP